MSETRRRIYPGDHYHSTRHRRTVRARFISRERVMGSVGSRQFLVGTGVLLAAFLAPTGTAASQPLAERGRYLVNSILACGNCHTPRSPTGELITDRALAGGGVSFTTPAFDATSSNITPDRQTGIGSWTDVEIKRALTEGVRPSHGRLANTSLAG